MAAAVGAVASLALVALAGVLQFARERSYPTPSIITEERLTLTSAPLLKRLTAGYNTLAADLYWIRSIQYYGSTKLRLAQAVSAPPGAGPDDEPPYALLAPLLDITTTLDPYFNIAYRFGAIFLAEPYPGGAGRPDLAVALLEKGLQARADKWEYMQDIGFVHYWWRRDTRAAAAWFDRASRAPGAPWWLRSLAANTLVQGGDRRASRLMWETIRESAEIDWLRRDAERRLLQLQALDDIDGLQRIVDDLASRGATLEPGWGWLIARRILPGVPVDPSGAPYVLDPDGRVRLSPGSALFPLPSEPQSLGPAS
jgi:hypothetical protein